MRRRLITEADVLAVPRGSAIPVGASDLITPAARDAALLRDSRFLTTAEPAGESDQTIGPLPLPTALPDGDYLLEIRDGSARIRRIDP